MGRQRVAATVASFVALALFLSGCNGNGNDEELPFSLESQVVVQADRAVPMAFAPDGRLFFGEQYTGTIRVLLPDGQLQADPFAQLEVATAAAPDWGLTGLAIAPDFAENPFVYVFFTQFVTPGDMPTAKPVIVRFTDVNGGGEEQTVISDDFPETFPGRHGFNANGRLRFDSDGVLYASIGDYDVFEADPNRLAGAAGPVGKLLRIDPADGSAPPDNPFVADPAADPRVFARGFREPFPFTVHPESGVIYGTDNTTGTCEELNIIEAGGDYSWPVGMFPFSDCSAGGQRPGIHYFAKPDAQPTDHLSFVEVSGLAFVAESTYPALGDSLLVCETIRVDPAGTGALRRVMLTGAELNQVGADDLITAGCRSDLAVSPDGMLYYATDTEIRRLVPRAAERTIPR